MSATAAQTMQARREDTASFGMWVFLATEVLFFGALFTGFLVYRLAYPESFAAGSNELDIWLGGLNTAVLLTSSLTMALAVAAARTQTLPLTLAGLVATAGLGCAFLAVKALEYSREIAHGLAPWLADSSFTLAAGKPAHNELFFNFYFAMTGLHALHLAAGIVTVLVVIVYLLRHQTPAAVAQIETAGLYWHFVDVVWIFLYPALYLIPS